MPNANRVYVATPEGGGNRTSFIDKGLNFLFLVGGGWAVYKFLILPEIQKKEAAEAFNTAGSSKEEQQAIALRQNMGLLDYLYNRNEAKILAIAKEITNLDLVIQKYRLSYKGDELMIDLEGHMDAENFQKFLTITRRNITNTDGSGAKPTKFKAPAGTILLARADANIRKTPVVFGNKKHDKWLPFRKSNVIKIAKAGQVVGIATGRTETDTKATLFLEVKVLKKAKATEFYFCWVAASQVSPMPLPEYKAKAPATVTITQEEYDNTASRLEGFTEYTLIQSTIL
jgi:hypothetical protein